MYSDVKVNISNGPHVCSCLGHIKVGWSAHTRDIQDPSHYLAVVVVRLNWTN